MLQNISCAPERFVVGNIQVTMYNMEEVKTFCPTAKGPFISAVVRQLPTT